MKLDRKLNLIIPVEREGGTVYIHSTPISREVFEIYFLVISKTFAAIYSEGLGVTAGPRVAAMMLKKVAQDLGMWEGVERGLMAEIRRLTNVAAPGDRGWTTFPFQEALDQGFIDGDDAAEIENALAFFTVASAMHKRADLPAILDGASRLWGAQTSSSNSTEFAASLLTSKGAESSGETAAVSSLPS